MVDGGIVLVDLYLFPLAILGQYEKTKEREHKRYTQVINKYTLED